MVKFPLFGVCLFSQEIRFSSFPPLCSCDASLPAFPISPKRHLKGLWTFSAAIYITSVHKLSHFISKYNVIPLPPNYSAGD